MAYTKQQLTIDLSGRGGLADKYYGDINAFGFSGDLSAGQPQYRQTVKDVNQDKDGQMVAGIFNPLRKYGYLSPAVGTVYGIASGTTDCLLVGATRYDIQNDKIYLLTNITGTANPAPLFRFDGIDSETLQTDRTMPASSTFGGALEIYTIYDGTSANRCLFYSYKASTGAWRAGYKQLDNNTSGSGAGTFVDNWLGSGGSVTGTFEPNSNGEMKFVVGNDGYMYILNANEVHRADGTQLGGTSGQITKDVLLAPTNVRFTHGVDFRSNLYFAMQKSDVSSTHNATVKEGANFTSECGIYIWNHQASFANSADYIPILGVREIRALWVSPKNDVRCITVSANGVTQIRVYDGTQFQVVKELGADAYPNYNDSLTVVGGFTVWLGYDGMLYYHGSEGVDINITGYGTVREEKEFLFIMGTVGGTGLQNVLGGAIIYAGSNGYSTGGTNEKPHPEAFHLNYSISSTNKFGKFFPFSNGTLTGGLTTTINSNPTPIFTPARILPTLSTLKHLTVFMVRETGLTPGITDATISIYTNGNTTPLMTKNIQTDDILKGYISIEINQAFVDVVQLSIAYTTIAMSNKRFNPSYAVVDYVPTDTLK